MWWIFGGALVLGTVVVGIGIWLLGPTLRTFRGPAFEPTARDDESIYRAQQSGDSHGAGQ